MRPIDFFPRSHVLSMTLQYLKSRGTWSLAAGLTGLLVVACGGSSAGEGSGANVVATSAPGAASAATTITGSSMSDEERDLRIKLANLYTPQEGVEITAIRQAADTGDTAFIAPIVDLAAVGFADDERAAIADALTRLTGQEFDGSRFDLYEDAYIWLGRHPEIEPVPGYDAWKGELYGVVDRRFIDFFYEGVPARVPISGAQWGGVGVDGIPPLDNPKFVEPEGATYLGFDETVFGVTINGDARAYPLRILAWHELTNDVVGGKPVALVY